jgi:hypothetical protein
MTFNDHYPQDCPPSDAKPTANNVAFRFLSKDAVSVTDKDFMSYYDKEKYQMSCQARGLSIYTNEEGVAKARNLIPGFKKRKVAKGILEPDMGMLKNTPSKIENHHTWWVALSPPKTPESLFNLV